eukprot:1782636-Karenia_brevis.AAC.1
MASQAADEDVLAARLVEACSDMKFAINVEIKANLAEAKAATVASTAKLARRIRRALGQDGGAECETTEALGIDFSSGRAYRQRLPVQKKRLRMVTKRKR